MITKNQTTNWENLGTKSVEKHTINVFLISNLSKTLMIHDLHLIWYRNIEWFSLVLKEYHTFSKTKNLAIRFEI